MPDEPAVVYVCPGCGQPVAPGQDYVIAEEYKLEPGFALHLKRVDLAESVQRRFHVGHVRGRTGEYFYELSPQPEGHHPSQ
jgi:hypothetical protein